MERCTDAKIPKLHKKVSFDNKVHRMNFARKSTFEMVKQRRSAINKHMVLRLTKVDITGYKLPNTVSESESGKCARIIPVEDILFCSRTKPVSKKSHSSGASIVIPTESNDPPPLSLNSKRSHALSSSLETVLIVNPPCKVPSDTSSTPTIKDHNEPRMKSPEEIEYALKLSETIEKITGKTTKKKKKKKKRSVIKTRELTV